MTFREWQSLASEQAARTLHERILQRLPPAQQRAVFAHLFDAAELARRLAAAAPGPLAGVPFLVKDLFDLASVPTRAGSTFLTEIRATPAQDSALVRAFADFGAVPAGKTHMHEFAYGITGENPHYGDCERPGFPGRTTGGSSSGSAAAVAAGIVPLALGSDTGGSVRVPAAFCGIFGVRFTPRDRWIADAFPLAPRYDTAGWFTATADDMRTTLRALVGSQDAAREPRGCYLELPGLDPGVAFACKTAARTFAESAEPALAEELRQGFQRSAETYNTMVAIEAWDVHRGWAERYRERYSPGVWQRLTRIQNIDARQRAAADEHTAAVHALWARFFRDFDFLVLPASPTAAPTKAESTLEHRGRILALTAPASIGGLPVLTIPVALPTGLTTGLQIVVNSSHSPVFAWALARTTGR